MYESEYCKVVYLEEKNAVLSTWKQFCKDNDYRNPFWYALELINKHHITTWITDTNNGFENKDDDTTWLLEEFMPKVIESSVKKIVFVIQKDSPLMDEILGQKEALEEFFEVHLIEGLDNAK